MNVLCVPRRLASSRYEQHTPPSERWAPCSVSARMRRWRLRAASLIVGLVLAVGSATCTAATAGPSAAAVFDVVVYGATPAGIAAAVAASRSGAARGAAVSVALVDPHARPGGMMSGGIGFDDVDTALVSAAGLAHPGDVPPAVYGTSLYAEKAAGVLAHYVALGPAAANMSKHGTHHEPHVAEAVLRELLSAANVSLLLTRVLLAVGTTTVPSPSSQSSTSPAVGTAAGGGGGAAGSAAVVITNATFGSAVSSRAPSPSRASGSSASASPAEEAARGGRGVAQETVVSAAVWIDATYEGDLLYMAGAPTRQGRESRATYGEINAGVVLQDFSVHHFLRGSTGAASPRLPAMTWRLCFSTNASNRVPLTAPPPGYNASRYAGYVADVAAGRMSSVWDAWSGCRPLPPTGTKCDMNCNPRPLGFIWAGSEKEEYLVAAPGSADRTRLLEQLRDLTLGLLYFQQNDPAVPEAARKDALRYGLCADEFDDTGNFPFQLYIREGRRAVGYTTLTERDLVPATPDGRPPLRRSSVAVGSYAIDAFPASEVQPARGQRTASTALEGYVGMETELVAPNTLPARMLALPGFPNLVAGAAASASHVAFSSVRLEPTWMLVGQAAGVLSGLALAAAASSSTPAAAVSTATTARPAAAAPPRQVHSHFHQPRHGVAAVAVDVGAVPLLQLQRATVAAGVPIVFYSDLPGPGNSSDGRTADAAEYTAMQVLGPHGVADAESFSARLGAPLERVRAAAWLAGARRARNSTVGRLAPLAPDAPGVRWADFGPGDAFFADAVAMARAGIVTPEPDAAAFFHPDWTVSSAGLAEWVALACGGNESIPGTNASVGAAAVAVYAACVA